MNSKQCACDTVTILTDAWYNQVCESLNLSVKNFQLTQPVATPSNDESVWAYINLVPPKTLKFNYWYYHQPSFFSQYAAIVNQLQFPNSAFEKDIGAATYKKWNAYLQSLSPQPPENTLPTVWFQWAMVNAPSVANIGRSDLSCQVLINSGQAALAPYEGSNAALPDFSPTFSDLKTLLQSSSAAVFSFNSNNANPDVSGSWSPGIDINYFGIWTGSWCGFTINKKFAQSTISITVQFDHYTVVPVIPGAWYNSGLLNLALSSQSAPPWSSGTTWNNYFGPDGTMNYAIGAVIAADGISLTLTSDADFTIEEQAAIRSQIRSGYWPVYSLENTAVISNNISFEAGKTIINFSSQPGNPVLIGNNVFGIKQYLGAAG